MSLSYKIQQTLKEYDNILYLMIEIRVVLSEGKLEHRAIPIGLSVTDNNNSVDSFISIISGNQKELLTYFTVDVFTNFSNNSEIKFGYGAELINVIENVNVHAVAQLPDLLENIPHEIADNNWLNSLQ